MAEGPTDTSASRVAWYKRALGGWKLALALFATFIVGLAAGLSDTAKDQEIEDLKAENASVTEELDQRERQYDIAVESRVKAVNDLEQAKKDVQSAEAEAEQEAQAAIADDQAQLEAQQSELDAQAADLDAQQQTLEANTIPDGIWQAGTDFEAGLYRAPGGGGCYWAKLNSADTNDIASNGLGKNPTVEIDTPFFETAGCGEWTKIG